MKSRQSRLALAATLLATFALGACKKTGSEPGGYGVNVTIDATALSSAQRGTITVANMTVVDTTKTASTPVKRTLDILAPLKGGVVHFHYTPGSDVDMTDVLRFGVDVLAGTTLVSSGSSADTTLVPMKAVDALIKLAGTGDGGVPPDGGAGKINGIACVTDDECGSGFCTDGVCCNERCDDVCVSCSQTPTKGTCTPYAADTDPELECGPTADTTPSGGTDASTGDGATADGATADAATTDGATADGPGAATADAGDDGAESDAATIMTPDGGFKTMPAACGGTCGGARACKYPDTTKSCGTPFCNSSKEFASFLCDGKGGCGIALGECSNYSCNDATGSCRTACSDPQHCLSDSYCTAAGACMPKKADSIPCGLPNECASGNCSGAAGASVCCNTACNENGLSCTQAGHVGQCQCMGVTCAAGVACQVFYRDFDHDTYGDANGTIAAGTAMAGCMGSPPPTGFVADHTDCDDNNVNAHPGQTSYFGTPRVNNTYDYDCSGGEEPLTPTYLGGQCRFCGPTSSCTSTTTSCTSTSQTGSFQCPLEGSRPIIEEPVASLESSASPLDLTSRASGVGIVPIQPIFTYCCGCRSADKSGFTSATKCGDFNYVYTCGACNGSVANPQSAVRTQQLCH